MPAFLVPSLLRLELLRFISGDSGTWASAPEVSLALGCCGYDADVVGARARKDIGRVSATWEPELRVTLVVGDDILFGGVL
jgi:hypothetical protein